MQIIPAADLPQAEQDAFVAAAPMATFLHSRRYLEYHGDRFRDASLAVIDDAGKLTGLFPAALAPDDARCVVSHPGLSYGGMLHTGGLKGPRMFDALQAVGRKFADAGMHSVRYKTVPSIYASIPSDDDVHALFRLGARRYRCDLLNTIDLENRPSPSSRRKRGLKKAKKAGLDVRRGQEFLQGFWSVLADTLARRHGVEPVHSADELLELQARFPAEIECIVAMSANEIVAGTVLFHTPQVTHAQYIAATPAGQAASALDLVFETCIDEAGTRGARYFDFGSSTEDGGRVVNEGLFKFKSEFGAGTVRHEFYEWDLRAL